MESILAPGTSAGTSDDIVIAAGASVTVGIYCATDRSLPAGISFSVVQATPGADAPVAALGNDARALRLAGPATFRVKRPAYSGHAFGVFVVTE